jgi:hypothetical protein
MASDNQFNQENQFCVCGLYSRLCGVAWRGVVWCGVERYFLTRLFVTSRLRLDSTLLYSTLLYSTMRRNKLNVVSTGQGLRQRRKLSTIRFHGFATLDFDSDSTLLLLLLLQHLFRERERKNESNRIESSSPLHSLTHSLTHFPLTPTARHTPFLFFPPIFFILVPIPILILNIIFILYFN